MTVVKDPELLRELKPIWRRFGCAICGRTVSDETESGYDIELAHIHGRGMGGGKRMDTVKEILGLCGNLTPNQCHRRVDQHEIVLFENTAGDEAWQVRRGPPLSMPYMPEGNRNAFSYGRVRRPRMNGRTERVGPGEPSRSVGSLAQGALAVSRERQDPEGGPGPISREPSTALVRREADDVPGPSFQYPAVAEDALHADSPQGRYELVRSLVRRSEQSRLAAALLLLKAWEDGEYEQLGKEWPEYYSECGISKSDASKMLTVARTFRGRIHELPEHDRDELSLERAYMAARLVKAETHSHSDALAVAVSTPASGIVALLKHDEPADRCVCPACGSNHVKQQEVQE